MSRFTTLQDALDHGIDYLGGNPSDQPIRDCMRAASEAYRDLANAFNWSYLYTQGRIITSAMFVDEDATLSYTQTGGTYERMATISGGTWPDWAADGYIRVGQVAYKVDERKSATVVTFDEQVNPGADIASGTEFLMYRDTYLLPEDYIAQDQALYEQNFGGMRYTHPRDWMYTNRYIYASGIPEAYTITGDKKYPGRLVLRLFPWPTEQKSVDFIYKRRPSKLIIANATAGTASVSAGDTAVTGVGTAFTPQMVGSVIRLSATVKPPTSLIMSFAKSGNAAAFESVVAAYVSPTSLVLADPADTDYAGVGYTISDAVDIEPGSMLNAYLRCIEMHLGMSRTLKDKPSARLQYQAALEEAKAADSRSFQGRAAGQSRPLRRRLRDYPQDLSQTY